MKLLPYILFEKYIYILALEMASPGNQHCANCIGALSFPISAHLQHRLTPCSDERGDMSCDTTAESGNNKRNKMNTVAPIASLGTFSQPVTYSVTFRITFLIFYC